MDCEETEPGSGLLGSVKCVGNWPPGPFWSSLKKKEWPESRRRAAWDEWTASRTGETKGASSSFRAEVPYLHRDGSQRPASPRLVRLRDRADVDAGSWSEDAVESTLADCADEQHDAPTPARAAVVRGRAAGALQHLRQREGAAGPSSPSSGACNHAAQTRGMLAYYDGTWEGGAPTTDAILTEALVLLELQASAGAASSAGTNAVAATVASACRPHRRTSCSAGCRHSEPPR